MDFGTLVMTTQLILGLSLLVFVHELGHFLAAKMFGMRVHKFYIFFDAWGKKLWSTTKKGTEYGIGWLPLGGYVKIYGMIDESMDKEAIAAEPQANEFRSKPAWQRLIVMLGGIIFNIILGVIIFTFVYKTYVKDYLPSSEVKEIYAHKLAQEQGLKTGDKILTVNGKNLKRWRDVAGPSTMIGSVLEIERNGQKQNVIIKDIPFKRFGEGFIEPKFMDVSISEFSEEVLNAKNAGFEKGDVIKKINGEKIFNFYGIVDVLDKNKSKNVTVEVERENVRKNLDVAVNKDGIIGFRPNFSFDKYYKSKKYSITDALIFSMKDGWEAIYTNWKGFGRIARGEESFRKNIKSPIGMISFFPSTWDPARFWRLTGLISFILAFMNLLPIPALDGGHATFLLYEMITRRKPSEKFLMQAQMVGMVILLGFMVFAFGNDIYNLIFGIE